MKGGNFEREIAAKLSLWWTNGKRDDVFYRSDGSGSRFTARRKKGKDTSGQSGDICASDSIGEPLTKQWSIECKTGYGRKTESGITRWDILDLLDSSQKQTILEKMWEQCCRDAELANREPILIFRRNGRKSCIMIKESYWDKITFEGNYGMGIHFNGLTIMSLKTFLDRIKPEIIKKRSK